MSDIMFALHLRQHLQHTSTAYIYSIHLQRASTSSSTSPLPRLPCKLRRVATNRCEKVGRAHRTPPALPQLLHELREGIHDRTTAPEAVVEVHLRRMHVQLKVVDQRYRVDECLEGGIHETGIPEVLQTAP